MVGISRISNVQACGKLPFDDPITKIRCFSLQIGVVFHTPLPLYDVSFRRTPIGETVLLN